MQVRRADAPGRTEHDGTTYYFCSDKCHDKFTSAPDKYAAGQPAEPMHGSEASHRDPVCGMTVDPASPGATATVGGVAYLFCCQGCADTFVADPRKFLSAPAEHRS
jgi:YHS domain-containing protein